MALNYYALENLQVSHSANLLQMVTSYDPSKSFVFVAIYKSNMKPMTIEPPADAVMRWLPNSSHVRVVATFIIATKHAKQKTGPTTKKRVTS